ncbi:MAG: transcriptional regulator [Planctomycetaceae bacterium]|nr:MAG: transcriptional regulator [Planctomycetaceae bacterium]
MNGRPRLDDQERQFLRVLHDLREASIQDLCRALKVTATAVRQRLHRLESMGMVERLTVRGGRGRPYHRYVLTPIGRRELGDNYPELILLLWEEILRLQPTSVRQQVLQRIEDRLAQRYGLAVHGQEWSHRMEQLARILAERGFSAEVIREDCDLLPRLREHHCPYQELAEVDGTICEVEQNVFARIVGAPLVLTQCCRQGDHVCEFRLQPERTGAETPALAPVISGTLD